MSSRSSEFECRYQSLILASRKDYALASQEQRLGILPCEEQVFDVSNYCQHSGNPCNRTTRGSFSSPASTQRRIMPFTRASLWIHGYFLHEVIVPNSASFIQHSSTVFVKRMQYSYDLSNNEREPGKEKSTTNDDAETKSRTSIPGVGIRSDILGSPSQLSAISPKTKSNDFLRRPAKLVGSKTVKNTPARNAPDLALAFTESAFPSLGYSSQPSQDGWRFIWGHRQIIILGRGLPDCTFSSLILVAPRVQHHL
jgi:hypothetical protein